MPRQNLSSHPWPQTIYEPVATNSKKSLSELMQAPQPPFSPSQAARSPHSGFSPAHPSFYAMQQRQHPFARPQVAAPSPQQQRGVQMRSPPMVPMPLPRRAPFAHHPVKRPATPPEDKENGAAERLPMQRVYSPASAPPQAPGDSLPAPTTPTRAPHEQRRRELRLKWQKIYGPSITEMMLSQYDDCHSPESGRTRNDGMPEPSPSYAVAEEGEFVSSAAASPSPTPSFARMSPNSGFRPRASVAMAAAACAVAMVSPMDDCDGDESMGIAGETRRPTARRRKMEASAESQEGRFHKFAKRRRVPS